MRFLNLIIIGEAATTFKTAINKRRDDITIVTYSATDVFAQALASREIACDRLLLSEDAVADAGAPADEVSGKLATFKEMLEQYYAGIQIVLLLKNEAYLQVCTDVLYDTDAYAVFCVGCSMNLPFLVHTATMSMSDLRSTYDNFLYHAAEVTNNTTYEALSETVTFNDEIDDSISGFDVEYNTENTEDFDNGEGYAMDYTDETAYDAPDTNDCDADGVTADSSDTFEYNTDDFDFDTAAHEYAGDHSVDTDTLPTVADDFDDFGTFQNVSSSNNAELNPVNTNIDTFEETASDMYAAEFDETISGTFTGTQGSVPTDNLSSDNAAVKTAPTNVPKPSILPKVPKSKKTNKPTVTAGKTTDQTTVEPIAKTAATNAVNSVITHGKKHVGKTTQAAQTQTNIQNTVSFKYSQIVQGRTNAIFVVTGDRRAGLTTTAMSIAEHFASAVPALYVDFDTQFRGSLCYLSIDELSCSSNIVQNGLGALKSGRNVRTVAFRSDSEIPFDSIVSLPNYALEDEQLKQAQLQLFYQHEYNAVVIDCPFNNLYLLEDVLGQATVYVCVTGDMANSSSTLLMLDALNPNAETTLKITKPLSEKGVAMLSRAQYLITGTDTKSFSGHMTYLDGLYGLSTNDINWAKLPVAGAVQNLVGVLQQMV